MESDAGSRRWLLLIHQLPSEPSKLRVKVWRRLQSVGAVLLKNSVYVLPSSTEAREDFEWIRGEIVAEGGEAVVFAADTVDELTGDEVIDAFIAARRSDWRELRERAEEVRAGVEGAGREPSDDRLRREIAALRNRAARIDKIDYFDAPGREEALASIASAEAGARTGRAGSDSTPTHQVAAFRGRRWMTRPRPGVDRMASAWLIRRFIDPEARFSFAERIPPDEELVPFDMFGVEFGHHGDRCTFETLRGAFGVNGDAVTRIARIVHDLDLHSETATEPETATIGRLVAGLRQAHDDDERLLEAGVDVFEALYRSFRGESSGS